MPPSSSSSSSSNPHSRSSRGGHRVILLLDLDCFYAQCECIRLGLDATVTPLALMQWNSALAVTYPARARFDIKRGDGWDCIQKKSKSSQQQQQRQQQQQQKNEQCSSNNDDDDDDKNYNGKFDECLAIHVPILTTNHDETDNNDNVDPADIDSIQDEYNRIFGLTPEEKERCRLQELGVRKFAHQGKASIERYRIASANIFTTVLEYCQELDSSIVLERASIDEFFIDVTAAVFAASASSASSGLSLGTFDSAVVRRETVIVGQEQNEGNNHEHGEDVGGCGGGGDDDAEDKDHVQALWRGCAIAHDIRNAVRQQLGFTLSAGIGPNKSIAKLSASYGKPNGQAMTLPQHVAYLLNQTPISSCRNLGGKRGKQLQALLPSNVPTMVGSIARYLSLPDLQHKLSAAHYGSSNSNCSATSTNTQQQAHELAVWVYNLARGIDHEPVVSKNESALLTKSITAFKALPHVNNNASGAKHQGRHQHHSLAEAKPWLLLLAKELVNRVERDAARHARYPRQCTIHYIVASTASAASAGSSSNRNITSSSNSRTIRMSFPLARLSTQQKIQELCTKPMLLIGNKEQNQDNHLRITHIGLCAVNFLVRDVSTRSIDSYFQSSATPATAAAADKSDDAALVVLQHPEPSSLSSPVCIESSHTVAATLASATARTSSSSDAARTSTPCRAKTLASDLELAKKMQKQFDREQRVLEAMDAGMSRKKKNKARRGSTTTSQSDHKTRRIDSFFTKR
jgi:DNA polymerase eta